MLQAQPQSTSARPTLTFLIQDERGVSFQTTSMDVYGRLHEHGSGALTPTATHDSVAERAAEKGWTIVAETADPAVGYEWVEQHGGFGPVGFE